MTKLVVEELITTLSQSFALALNKRYHVEGLKIYLVMFNAPAGTFTVSIKSGATTLASKDFDSAEIKTDLSTSDNYAHIYKGIVFDTDLALDDGSYSIELSSAGYTFSESSYLGWVKDHDQVFFDTDYTLDTVATHPLTFHLLEKKKI